MWSKRTLVYVEPKADPARVLQNVQRDKTGQVTVNTSQETDNYVAKQVKYTVEDFHSVVKDMRLADLLGQVGVLQLTAKKDNAEVSLARDEDAQRGYFNEWYSWMRPGLSVSVAPQHVDSWKAYHDVSETMRDTLLETIGVDGGPTRSEMVFEKEWWTWSLLQGSGDVRLGLRQLFLALGLENSDDIDGDIETDAYDAAEVVLDKNRLSVYLYSCRLAGTSSVEIFGGSSAVDRHEFLIVTEMAPVDENSRPELTPDRFLQGIRGGGDAELIPTMFVHMPSEYVLPNAGFRLRADQTESASMHPTLRFDIESADPDGDIDVPRDEDIADPDECRLHVELELSNEYILDRYELDRLANSRHSCLDRLYSISNGGMDLELPSHRVPEWGSSVDLVVDPACVGLHNGSFSVPVHLRYPDPAAEPSRHSDVSRLQPPSAQVYWLCPVDAATVAPAVAASFYSEPGRFPLAAEPAASARRYYYARHSDNNATNSSPVFVPRGDGRLAGEVDAATAFLVATCSLLLAAVAIFKR